MKIDPFDHERLDPSIAKKKMKHFSKSSKSKKNKNEKDKQGRVIFLSPEAIEVYQDQHLHLCSLKGSLKKELKENKNRLACGDLVLFDPDKKVITELLPRKTILMRQNPSHKHKEQILATNIDILLITASVLQPKLNPYLIDLYLIAAQHANLTPIILINKVDLLKEQATSSVEQEAQLLEELTSQYKQLNIPLIEVSALCQSNLEKLKQYIQNRACVFSGESGVGKSSLINKLTQNNLKVSEVSAKLKGTHTTTSARLLTLENEGFCVDTPGVQSFSFKHLKPLQVKAYFPELNQLHCQFSDCLHQGEKGCQIELALEKKEVTPLRLASYHRILDELTPSS